MLRWHQPAPNSEEMHKRRACEQCNATPPPMLPGAHKARFTVRSQRQIERLMCGAHASRGRAGGGINRFATAGGACDSWAMVTWLCLGICPLRNNWFFTQFRLIMLSHAAHEQLFFFLFLFQPCCWLDILMTHDLWTVGPAGAMPYDQWLATKSDLRSSFVGQTVYELCCTVYTQSGVSNPI